MKKIKGIKLLVVLLIGLSFDSCISNNGRMYTNLSFPIGIRARKKRIKPPQEFIEAIWDYKKENGSWPFSERAFEMKAGRNVMDKLVNSGFLSWHIGLKTLDTMEVHFVHEPVYVQTVSFFAFDGKDVKILTRFVSSTRSYKTELER